MAIQAVAGNMRERKTGSIINVTSSAGLQGTIGQINYAAAKLAMEWQHCVLEAVRVWTPSSKLFIRDKAHGLRSGAGVKVSAV